MSQVRCQGVTTNAAEDDINRESVMKTPSIKQCNRVGKTPGNLIVWGLLLFALLAIVLHFSNATAANACPPESPQTVAARQVITDFLNARQAQFAGFQSTLSATDALLQHSLAGPAQSQVPLAKLRSNPFGAGAVDRATDADPVSQEKSDADRVAMLADLQKLQLQSIVASGDHPQCMIDGRLYQEGDKIDSFTIESIDAGVVVVRNGGYRFELKIAS
jgi:hypothetical protein